MAYWTSLVNITTDRLGNTWVTLPTSPAALTTAIPTFNPRSDPWLISTVWEKFDGEPPMTCAVTDDTSTRLSMPLRASSSWASRTIARAAMNAPSC